MILRHGGLGLGTVESTDSGPLLRVVAYDAGSAGATAVGVPLTGVAPDDGPAQRWADRPAVATLAVFDASLEPYAFGLQHYDPFESLGSSLDRLGRGVEAEPGARPSESAIVMAVWAAMEGDLFRFAFDGGFTADLELVRGGAEWYRFARLNDMYRATIKAIAPFGITPRSWTAWLRDQAAPVPRPRGLAASLERVLCRGIDAMHGAILCRAEPGSIFALR